MYGVYGYMYGINRKAETRRSEENEKTKKMKKMKREKKTKKRKGKKKRKRASSLHGWQRRLPASLREVGLRCTAGDAGYRRRLARLDFALLAALRSLYLHLWHVPGMRPSAIHLLHAAAMSRMLFSRVSSFCTRPLREVCGGLTIRERASWLLPSVSSRLSSPASMLRPCAPRRKNFVVQMNSLHALNQRRPPRRQQPLPQRPSRSRQPARSYTWYTRSRSRWRKETSKALISASSSI